MEENKNEEIDIEEETPVGPKVIKKSALDYNLSWILIIVVAIAAVLIGNTNVSNVGGYVKNSVLYILLEVILSFVAGAIFYSLGKISFGLYVEIFGMKLGFPEGKFKFTAPKNIWALADFRLVLSPKKENPNPTLMLLGGSIGIIVFQTIMVVLGFVVKNQVFHLSTLFSCGYIGLVVLYQLIPVRTDYFNDGFTLVKTRKEDDRSAYNLYLTNLEKDFLMKPIVAKHFDNSNSYIKANCLYYQYLSELYQDNLEEAVKVLDEAFYLTPLMTFENMTKVKGEKIFILSLADENEKADKLFRGYTHDERTEIEKTKNLMSCRIALITSGVIETEFDSCKSIIAKFNSMIKEYETNERVEKEQYLFNLALEKVKTMHPEWNLDDSESDENDEDEDNLSENKPSSNTSQKDDDNEEDEDE